MPEAKLIDAVIVSTDDDEIASTATTYGAQVVRRPAEISGDTASSESALIHTLDMLAKENLVPEITVFLQCTSPFTTGVDIDVVVQALIDENTQAALAVTEDHGFLWRLNQDGTASGINHDHLKPRKRRQDLETQYLETGAVYAMRTQAFLEKGTRFCGPTVAVPIASPPIDIDTEADLRLADIYYNAKMSNCAPTVVPSGIRLLATDFDGVHTDDMVYVDENGVENVRCSRSDGLGLEQLRKAGIPLLILSKETNIVVSRRAAKLKAEVLQQIDDKWPTLRAWLITQGLKPEQIAYVGNDINDLECLSHVGWACSPADANSAVKAVAHYISPKPGGQGALRDIAEKLLSSLIM
jgi:N-acylneuraminate cytidylyltransferase